MRYRLLRIPTYHSSDEVEAELDEVAANGWEVVSFGPTPGNDQLYTVLLRRNDPPQLDEGKR